jgi:hypothetical protein
MADMYSLNPKVLPGDPLKRQEHHKLLVLFLVLVIVGVVGGSIWWVNRSPAEVPSAAVPIVDRAAQEREEALAAIRNSTTVVTDADVRQALSAVSASKATVSEEDRAQALQALQEN